MRRQVKCYPQYEHVKSPPYKHYPFPGILSNRMAVAEQPPPLLLQTFPPCFFKPSLSTTACFIHVFPNKNVGSQIRSIMRLFAGTVTECFLIKAKMQ